MSDRSIAANDGSLHVNLAPLFLFGWRGTDIDSKAAQACFYFIPGAEESWPFLLCEWGPED